LIDRRELRGDTVSTIQRRAGPRRAEPGGHQIVAGLSLRNLVVDGRRTSVRLNPLLWDALRDIAHQRGKTVHELATDIASRQTGNLTAAIRVYIVEFYRAAAHQEFATSTAAHGELPRL
jgi:predicted DNA-binding ribbon-helix-helix protein